MNERIKELAEQAGFKLIRENCYDVVSTMSVQEFAELIIQECGNALSPMLRDMISRGQAYELIKKHFGVEE